MNPKLVTCFFSFLFFLINSATASNVQVQMTIEEAAAFEQLKRNGGLQNTAQAGSPLALLNNGTSCLNGIINQTSQGLTAKFEQQQNEANSLVGIADKFFELGKQCRNDLGDGLIKFEQAKLALLQEQNKIDANIKRQEIEYKKALLGVKRQCDATANTQFASVKESAADPNRVITARDGGLKALNGRNRRINKFRKLFYDNCMADPLTIEGVRIAGLEMSVNIQELQANLKSATDAMASTTKQIEFTQDLTLKNCAEGEEQLAYQEQIIRATNAQAAALVKKQNTFGLLGQGMSCIFGPNSVVPGFAPDATGNRQPTAL